jgi:hypothetical protein
MPFLQSVVMEYLERARSVKMEMMTVGMVALRTVFLKDRPLHMQRRHIVETAYGMKQVK